MKLILVMATLFGISISATSFAGDSLTGEQIKELFSNKTCDIEKVDVDNEKKKYLSAYTSADGKRLVDIPWKNKISKRKWWIKEDRFCASHPKHGDYCREIVNVGDGVYHALGNGKHLRTLSNFRDGNQL